MSRVEFSDPSGFSAPSGLSGPSAPSGVSHPSDSSLPSSQPGHSTGPGRAHPNARSFPTSLRGLSNGELLARVKHLVSREREVTLEILVHLIEVERRRLHVGLGYPSMFEYCHPTPGLLGLGGELDGSERPGASGTTRKSTGFSRKNEVNLITISLVASILDESNAKDLIGKIRGKSQREVESIVATYRPPVSMRDRAKPVCVAVPTPSAPQLNGPVGDLTASAGSEKRPNMAAASSAGGPPQATTVIASCSSQVATHPSPTSHPPPRLEAQSSSPIPRERAVHEEVRESEGPSLQQERLALVRSRSRSRARRVLEGPRSRSSASKDARNERKGRGERRSRVIVGPGKVVRSSVPSESEVSRRIPAATRDAVFARDKGRCTYVGSNGERCASRHHLQIDHIVPYARGGTNAVQNLRLLCERHNKLEAERIYGANRMKRHQARE